MQAETLAGLMGLAGAVVGAGGALLGGWLQARTARGERIEGYRRDAAQAALNELIQLRHELMVHDRERPMEPEYGLSGAFQDFMHAGERRLMAMNASVLLIPDPRLRERLERVYEVGNAWLLVPGLRAGGQISWMQAAAREGIEVLGAFLRGDPLPPEYEGFTTMRQHVAERN
ncbi:hypothetical protein [Streptomyces kebangsaanensis]|uniref:hypothetical protein n=1 Tax=Streptomyces kebangsaanensis TaxID=864058 RepID=UPI00093BBEDC|nr:hypothetical protein [Streptomyces kebangsaanensis]